jgi:hypothetical protein
MTTTDIIHGFYGLCVGGFIAAFGAMCAAEMLIRLQ